MVPATRSAKLRWVCARSCLVDHSFRGRADLGGQLLLAEAQTAPKAYEDRRVVRRYDHPAHSHRTTSATSIGPDDRKVRELWRELARPVTFFDLRSPDDLLDRVIGEFFRKMVRPPRLERGTPGLEGRCSIQLSYGRTV
jgi:hypothetical protein